MRSGAATASPPPEEAANLLDPALYSNDNKEIVRSQHEAALAW
eukprot:COSAG01_NODE_75906_length_191_cov_1048.836957_1_plen_42_part_01